MDEDAVLDQDQNLPVVEGIAALLDSPRLRQRRFEALPLRGPGAASTQVQGRQPGDMTTPVELSDLISSIATVGVLQPVLAEETPQKEGPPQLLLVTGERRLRACRWGAVHLPDNPHFASLPAVICPGPLSAEEKRIWQIVENLAREPLRPGEQAAALVLHRCAVLAGKLLRAGKPIPREVYDIEDPMARWEALERIRGHDSECAAPWPEVLRRLGLQLSPRKARELVAAFRALPRHLSEEMDEAKIRVHTRIRFARLLAGRQEAAEEIWAAVQARGAHHLLPAAVQAGLENPDTTAESALARAEQRQERANEARSAALTRDHGGLAAEVAEALDLSTDSAPPDQPSEAAPTDAPQGAETPTSTGASPATDTTTGGEEAPAADTSTGAFPAEPTQNSQGSAKTGEVPGDETEAPPSAAPAAPRPPVEAGAVVDALRELLAQLHAGQRLDRYVAGSLRLLLDEIRPLLEEVE